MILGGWIGYTMNIHGIRMINNLDVFAKDQKKSGG